MKIWHVIILLIFLASVMVGCGSKPATQQQQEIVNEAQNEAAPVDEQPIAEVEEILIDEADDVDLGEMV